MGYFHEDLIFFLVGQYRLLKELFDAAFQLLLSHCLLRGGVRFDLRTIKGNMIQTHEIKVQTDLNDLLENRD